MGISTNSKVAFICAQDETKWAQPFIDVFTKPTDQSALGYQSLDVAGAGYWEKEDMMTVPIAKCELRDGGKTIIVETDYYGVLGPARMDLPASLQAVVHTSVSCQNEPQDPLYAVLAEHIRTTDFDDTSKKVKPFWVGQDALKDKIYEYIDLFENNEFEQEADTLQNKLVEYFDAAFEHLVQQVKQMDGLTTPFLENPELATIKGYLESIDHDEKDPEDWMTDFNDNPMPPSLDYTSNEYIGLKGFPEFEVKSTDPAIQKEIDAHEAGVREEEEKEAAKLRSFTPVQVGMSRADYLSAFNAALNGEADLTGAVNAIAGLKLPPNANRKMRAYVLQRIESETSPVGKKLIAATEGAVVFELIQGLFRSGKYNSIELPDA